MDAVYVLRIDVDGTVTRCEGQDFLSLANAEFDNQLDIVTGYRGPEVPGTGETLVIGVHDRGRTMRPPLPINIKAWGLYARSPLVGPAYVANDCSYEDSNGRPPLPEQWVQLIEGPPVWIGDVVRARMNGVAAAEGRIWPT